MKPTVPTPFDTHEIERLTFLFDQLGFAMCTREDVAGSLQTVAQAYYSHVLHASLSPRVSQVRNDLRRLADRLHCGTPLPDRICTEAFNALLGCYPASTYDIIRLDSPDADAEQPQPTPLPIEIAASHDIISSALSNPKLGGRLKLNWQWHKRGSLVDKLIGRDVKARSDQAPYRDISSSALEARLAAFSESERADLIKVIEWTIARVERTCIPRPSTPGRRTTFQWAVGNVDRILAAGVIGVLWPDQVPENISSRYAVEIVDLVRRKVVADDNFVHHADVAYALGLRRAIAKHQARLNLTYAEMEKLNQQNVRLKARYRRLEIQLRGPIPKMPQRLNRLKGLMDAIGARITGNAAKVTAFDMDYIRLSNSVREIQRRLKFGDYHPPSRTTIPRITGRPLLTDTAT